MASTINKPFKRILVCPLDWGLGHATRCIPIIDYLLELDFEVLIASSGQALVLLQTEYPQLTFLELPAYNIHYHQRTPMLVSMLTQLPGLATTIIQERGQVKNAVREFQIDGIISDNRFGLGFKSLPSAYLTNQLQIKMPMSLRWLEPMLYWAHKLVWERFTEVWVPDFKSEPNISGELTHFPGLPDQIEYLGILSRFKNLPAHGPEYDVLALVSGPETHRTIFEQLLLEQLRDHPGNHLLVRGLPKSQEKSFTAGNCQVLNHLSGSKLNLALINSKMIVARCGYSTILDLTALGKQAILIPTPGQTEQEYLGEMLRAKGYYYTVNQAEFELKNAVLEASRFTGVKISQEAKPLLRRRIEILFGQSSD